MPEQQVCGEVLKYQIQTENLSLAQAKAWLNIIDETNYESYKKGIGADAGASISKPIAGLSKALDFSGFFKGNYDKFKETRDTFFSQNSGSQSMAQSIEIVHESLKDKQLDNWLECIKLNKSRNQPISITLSKDTDSSVTAKLEYNGIPGTSVRIDVTITNGSYEGKSTFKTKKLLYGSSFSFNIASKSQTDNIIIVANSNIGSDYAIFRAKPPIIDEKPSVEWGEWKLLPADWSKTVLNHGGNEWRIRVTFFPRLIINDSKGIKHIKITRENDGRSATIPVDEYRKMNKDDEYAFHNWPAEFKLDEFRNFPGKSDHVVLAKEAGEKLIEERKKMEAETQYTFAYKLQNGEEISIGTIPGM